MNSLFQHVDAKLGLVPKKEGTHLCPLTHVHALARARAHTLLSLPHPWLLAATSGRGQCQSGSGWWWVASQPTPAWLTGTHTGSLSPPRGREERGVFGMEEAQMEGARCDRRPLDPLSLT